MGHTFVISYFCPFSLAAQKQSVGWIWPMWHHSMLVPTPDNPWVAISPYGTVWGVCDFLSSVSLQQKFEAMDRPVLRLRVISSYGPALHLCITAQFYLESKGKYILKA